jgi:hypothetical protein
LAVFCKICRVSVIIRSNWGWASHRRATTPTTCGPAIEVPEELPYEVSLVLVVERTFTPGAEISGFILPEPSTVTGPRLENVARALLMSIAPVEKLLA